MNVNIYSVGQKPNQFLKFMCLVYDCYFLFDIWITFLCHHIQLTVTARHLNEVEAVQHVHLTNIPVWFGLLGDVSK